MLQYALFFTCQPRSRSTVTSSQARFFSNDTTNGTDYKGWAAIWPHLLTKMFKLRQKIQKSCLFVHFFVQYVFINVSTNTAPRDTKLGRRCQWAPTMLLGCTDGSPRAFLGFRLGTDTISAKTVFFDTFFHKLAKRVDTTNVTAGKIGSMYCPTGHSTATSPQLSVPVSCRKALSVLQFELFSAYSALSNVKTSEIFSQCWLALGSSKFLDKR